MKIFYNDLINVLYIGDLGKVLPSLMFNPSIARKYYKFIGTSVDKVKAFKEAFKMIN